MADEITEMDIRNAQAIDFTTTTLLNDYNSLVKNTAAETAVEGELDANLTSIQDLSTKIQDRQTHLKSLVEFNDRTKHQITALRLQLRSLVFVDIVLGLGVCTLIFKSAMR